MYRFSNSLPYLLARLGVRMGDLFARVIRHERLTLPMYRVLAALSEQGRPLRLGEIAELTSADVSTLSRIVAEWRVSEFRGQCSSAYTRATGRRTGQPSRQGFPKNEGGLYHRERYRAAHFRAR